VRRRAPARAKFTAVILPADPLGAAGFLVGTHR
jgi:hypothetical protein